MTGVRTALQYRGLRYSIGVAGLAFLFWLVPLFHVVSLESARHEAQMAEFNAADYVDEFWQGALLESAGSAVGLAELLAAFEQDFDAATERYGHRLGLSGTSYYMVSGQGHVTAVESMAVRVELDMAGQPEVVIGTGPVFGNAIRDGSGLLDINEFANIQDFNAISAEINLRVEEQVQPMLRENAAVGAEVKFVGGLELADSAGVPSLLKLVPVVIEFP